MSKSRALTTWPNSLGHWHRRRRLRARRVRESLSPEYNRRREEKAREEGKRNVRSTYNRWAPVSFAPYRWHGEIPQLSGNGASTPGFRRGHGHRRRSSRESERP